MGINNPVHILRNEAILDQLISDIGIEGLQIILAERGLLQAPVGDLEEITMEDFLIEYEEELLWKWSNKPSTLITYKSELSQFIRYINGKELLGETAFKVLIDKILGEYLHQKSYKTATYNKKVSFLKGLVKYAEGKKWIKQSSITCLDHVTSYLKVPKVLSQDNINELFVIIKENRYAVRDFAICYIMIMTGLRVGSAVGIQVKHIDWEEQTLRVFGKNIGTEGKTIPLTPTVILFLQDYLMTTIGDQYRLKKYQNMYLFSSSSEKHSKPSERSIQNIVKNAINKMTSLPEQMKERLNTHCFRHTFATKGIKEGVNLYYVSQLLLHADPEVTFRHYIHFTNKDLMEAAKKMQGNLCIRKGGGYHD